MSGLSRRQFLTRATALAAFTGVDLTILGAALAAADEPFDGPSTLAQTILQGTRGSKSYRVLTAGPGEPYIPRLDVRMRQGPRPDARCSISATSPTSMSSTLSHRGG
ncbi:hypothetical protein [Antrihabitans spumae]|uniref:Twin-arginine translocation signal domain-containing protein n=1 Tax=Antrihabitans spumae TaxID=3373370 RepID=A0ABW7K152_9NOCA